MTRLCCAYGMKATSLPLFRRQLGAVIRQQRQSLGLSQAALAGRLYCTVDYIGKVERGEQNLQIDTLDRIFTAILDAALASQQDTSMMAPVIPPGVALLHVMAMTFGIPLPAPLKRHLNPGKAGRQRATMDCKAHDGAQDAINPSEIVVLTACQHSAKTASELRHTLGCTSRNGNFKRALTHLMGIRLLQMTIPHRHRSKNQKYLTTARGHAFLAKHPSSSPSEIRNLPHESSPIPRLPSEI